MADELPRMIAAIMQNDDSAVSKGQLSVPQFWALHYLDQNGHMTVNELATALNRKISSASGLVNRMVKSGLITRTRDTVDRRVVHLALTAKSRRLIDHLVGNRKDGIRLTYSALTGEERALYLRLMDKILDGTRVAIVFFLLCSGVARTAFAEPEPLKAYSLQESIRIGLERSIPVANAVRNRQIAQTKKIRARSEAFPKITGLADYTRYDAENLIGTSVRNVGAEAALQVFAGGRTMAAIRAAKAYDRLTEEQEHRIRAAQVRDIAFSYHEVLLAQSEVAVLEQSVQQLMDFEKETREKYETGTASEFDWLSAKVKVRNEEPRLIRSRNNVEIAKEAFRNLTYIDETEFRLTDPLAYQRYEVDLERCIENSRQKRPELQEQSRTIDLRQEDIHQQRSQYYPRVNLFADYRFTDPDPYSFINGATGWQDHWTAGVRATWDLFDGGLRRADLGESRLNLAIAEDNYTDLERAVALEIRSQWLLVRDSEEAILATTESTELAQRALDISKARYDAGLGTYLEFTQANLELSNARLARNTALRAHQDAVIGLKYAAGILLEEYEDE